MFCTDTREFIFTTALISTMEELQSSESFWHFLWWDKILKYLRLCKGNSYSDLVNTANLVHNLFVVHLFLVYRDIQSTKHKILI